MAQDSLPSAFLRSVVRLGRGLHQHNAFTAASAMAFHFFLSFIPLLALGGLVLGMLVRQRGMDAVMAPFLEALPKEAAQLVRREVEGLAGSVSAPIAPVSVVGFLLVASTGTHHMMDVFEIAVGAQRRAWWKQRAIAFAWLAAMTGAVSGTAWALVTVDAELHRTELQAARVAAASASATAPILPSAPIATAAPTALPPSTVHGPVREGGDRRAAASTPSAPAPASTSGTSELLPKKRRAPSPILRAPWERLVAAIALLGVALAGLAALYRVAVQHPPGVTRRVLPGAALALTVWFLVSYVFGEYARSFGKYASFYGSLAAVTVILMWLYLTSLALLIGAELNAQLEGVRQHLTPKPLS